MPAGPKKWGKVTYFLSDDSQVLPNHLIYTSIEAESCKGKSIESENYTTKLKIARKNRYYFTLSISKKKDELNVFIYSFHHFFFCWASQNSGSFYSNGKLNFEKWNLMSKKNCSTFIEAKIFPQSCNIMMGIIRKHFLRI